MSIYAFMIGNLTRDPEIREVNTAAGPVKVCNFTVACSERSLPRNADGTLHTEFVRVAAWRGLADVCQQYLKKGRKVKIGGAFRQREYQDATGVQRSVIEFPNVTDVEMLDRAEQTQQNDAALPHQNVTGARQAAPAAQPATMPNYDAPPVDTGMTQIDDDELPF